MSFGGPLFYVEGYAPVEHDQPLPLSGENIDCGLYDVGLAKYTIYYPHGQKASLETMIPPGSCVTFAEVLFIFTGGAYVYQGNPPGWTIQTGAPEGWVIPPTLTEE